MKNVRAADATLAEEDGRWLMFVNIAAPGMLENWDELFLFVADHTAGAVDAASGEPDQVRRAILPAGGSPVQARWDSRILGVLNVAATSPSWIA